MTGFLTFGTFAFSIKKFQISKDWQGGAGHEMR
jgi:hypothetical protein